LAARQKIFRVIDGPELYVPGPVQREGQKAVVRGDEIIFFRAGQDDAPRRADARVDHGQEDGACRKEPKASGQDEAGRANIVRGSGMGDINEANRGVKAEDDGLERGDKKIVLTEIRHQGDRPGFHFFFILAHYPGPVK
jgi:hypothetical protein